MASQIQLCQLSCLPNNLSLTRKETSKLHIAISGLYWGESPHKGPVMGRPFPWYHVYETLVRYPGCLTMLLQARWIFLGFCIIIGLMKRVLYIDLYWRTSWIKVLIQWAMLISIFPLCVCVYVHTCTPMSKANDPADQEDACSQCSYFTFLACRHDDKWALVQIIAWHNRPLWHHMGSPRAG